MPLNSCPFCEQPNPPDAKFCNACGGALHLMPCPKCGAVNDVAAMDCYQCHARLRAAAPDGLDAELPSAEVPRPLPPRHPRILVGVAALAAAVVLAASYYGFRLSTRGNPPLPATAAGESSGPDGSTDAGTGAAIGQAPVQDSTPASPGNASPVAKAAATPSPGSPVAHRAPGTESKPRAERIPEDLRQEPAANGLIARPKPDETAKARRRHPPRQEVCTIAVAALGLCTMTPEERRLMESTAALKAAIAEPVAREPGKAGKQGPPPGEPCTEAVAALGLCSPASKRKGE